MAKFCRSMKRIQARSLLRDRRGVVAIIAGLCLTMMVGMAAMSIDLGLAFSRHSQLQGASDMAALSASFSVSPGATSQVNTAAATQSAMNALAGNGFPAGVATSTTSIGNYDSKRVVGSRFSTTALPVNAVHVFAQGTSPVIFGGVFTSASTMALGASSTATRIDLAGLTAGTTLIGIDSNQAQILNAVLGSFLGTSLNLTLVSYQGLASANVSAASLLPALATKAGLTTGTYGQLATASLTAGQIIQAVLSAATTSGTVSATAIAALAALPVSTSVPIPLASLIGLAAYTNQSIGSALPSSALAGTINLYSLVTAAAQLSGGSSTVSLVPSLTLPTNIGVVSIKMIVGQPAQSTPYLTFSPVGSTVRTSQVRLYITVSLAGVNLGILNLLPVTLQVPIYIEAASGQATLSAISCGANPPTDATVTVAAQTGLATAWIGTVTPAAFANFSQPVTPTPANLVTVAGVVPLNLNVLSGPDTDLQGSANLTFTQAQIQAKPPAYQTVNSTSGALNTSLFANMQISGNTLLPTQANLLAGLTPLLTVPTPPGVLNTIIAELLAALGIKLGSMDVTVPGVRCGVPVLVE
ncbi:hypothetical protein HN018_04415 [Lichenicola cladoniae]|uniref:DUF2134 domain-containing protein n=1 Tax=Lichenicola cladoniae TaxID=1484109 RepID=A0A6M8HLZ1_9PROT|nr:TadG family pilus assembly protein [Lichenicola cladoniae]NPD69961.1 hypothetical protein [Acetobacteraceae bacterium]QKE89379.1 hypothetical protein HN018_04415 [Lichenicola cladoniae]